MTWWIGRTCTAGNRLSEAVLRAEGAPLAPSSGVPRAGSRAVSKQMLLRRPKLGKLEGGDGRGVAPPVPIPNTVVKRPSADDTGACRWDNRSLPSSSTQPHRGVEQWQLVGLITRR